MPITWLVHKHRDPQSLSMRVPVLHVYEPTEQMLNTHKRLLSQRHKVARIHNRINTRTRLAAVPAVETEHPQLQYRQLRLHQIRVE